LMGQPEVKAEGLIALTGVGAEVFSELVGHADKSVGIWRGRLLPRDVGPNRRVLAVEVEPLFKSRFRIRLDSVNRAFRLANATIDAFIGMDDEHILALVEAVHGTDFNAISVLAPDTGLVDDVGHWWSLQQSGLPSEAENSKARIRGGELGHARDAEIR